MQSYLTILFLTSLIMFTSASLLRNKKNRNKNHQNSNSTIVIGSNQIIGEEKPLVNGFCFINTNGTVYDLNGLKNDDNDYKIETAGGIVYFNVCRNAIISCKGNSGAVTYNSNLLGDNCLQLAGNNTVSSSFYLIDDTAREKTALRMKLPEGDICSSDASKKYKTTIDFTCDEEAQAPIISAPIVNINSCEQKIYLTSKYACPKINVYSLWNKIQSNKWIFGLIIIGLGIFFCFFGEEFVKATQVIAGAALAMILVIYLILANSSVVLYTWQFWLILVFSLLIGCLAGWFMSKIQWLPGVVFGTLLGFVVGFVLFNLFLRFIQSNPVAVFWVTMCVCLIGGILLGYFFEESISIISTSVVGAYGIVRGISIMAGGFPDERQVYELGTKGEWSQMKNLLTPVVYAYLAGFVVLAALGMFIQFKFFYDGNKKKEKKDDENELLKEKK